MDPPSPDIIIRAMEPGDMPALTDVLSQPRAIWGTLQTPFVSLDARQKRQAENGPNDAGLVAAIDGKVIGFVGLHRGGLHRRNHTASLGMAVHDAYAGRGAGSALLAAVVDLAERWWNIKRLELNVYADNARAVELYERFGFQREGLHRAYAWRDGAYVDSLSMARLSL